MIELLVLLVFLVAIYLFFAIMFFAMSIQLEDLTIRESFRLSVLWPYYFVWVAYKLGRNDD